MQLQRPKRDISDRAGCRGTGPYQFSVVLQQQRWGIFDYTNYDLAPGVTMFMVQDCQVVGVDLLSTVTIYGSWSASTFYRL